MSAFINGLKGQFQVDSGPSLGRMLWQLVRFGGAFLVVREYVGNIIGVRRRFHWLHSSFASEIACCCRSQGLPWSPLSLAKANFWQKIVGSTSCQG